MKYFGRPTLNRQRRPPESLFRLYLIILHRHSCPHHVVVEGRPAVFSHEDRLDKETDLVDIMPEFLGNLELAVTVCRHYDSHVDVAVGGGVALRIGTEHHHLRLHVEARAYDSLVSADEFEGLVSGKCSFIHCWVSRDSPLSPLKRAINSQ